MLAVLTTALSLGVAPAPTHEEHALAAEGHGVKGQWWRNHQHHPHHPHNPHWHRPHSHNPHSHDPHSHDPHSHGPHNHIPFKLPWSDEEAANVKDCSKVVDGMCDKFEVVAKKSCAMEAIFTGEGNAKMPDWVPDAFDPAGKCDMPCISPFQGKESVCGLGCSDKFPFSECDGKNFIQKAACRTGVTGKRAACTYASAACTAWCIRFKDACRITSVACLASKPGAYALWGTCKATAKACNESPPPAPPPPYVTVHGLASQTLISCPTSHAPDRFALACLPWPALPSELRVMFCVANR